MSSTRHKIDAVCSDFVAMHQWSGHMRKMQGLLSFVGLSISDRTANTCLANLDKVYKASGALVDRLAAPPYELHFECKLPSSSDYLARTRAMLAISRMPPPVNPLILLHERACAALHELLLVGLRLRSTSSVPLLPELWALVVGQVLCMKVGGRRVPMIGRFGYMRDGALRVVLAPPISVPRMQAFRSGIGSVLSAASSSVNPERVAAQAAALLGDRKVRNSTDSVRSLLDAFALPFPDEMLADPPVALRLTVCVGGAARGDDQVEGSGVGGAGAARVGVGAALHIRRGWVQCMPASRPSPCI